MSFRTLVARAAPWWWVAALVFWTVGAIAAVNRIAHAIAIGAKVYLFDWHVYAAGAHDFVTRDLYQVPLVSVHRMPVSSFNLPPGAALTALPFIVVPDDVGGLLWVVLGYAAVAAAAVLTARIIGARPVWLWSGAAFFVVVLSDLGRGALLGNNTALVLLLVVGFLTAHLADHAKLSGVLLGLAIACKLWPAALLVPLARERSWQTFGWAAGSAVVIFGVALLWLGGPGVVGPMIKALSIDVEPRDGQLLLAFTWLRVHTEWWPVWGGYVVALLLLLIPARGLTGYGIATLAGLSAIPNLWLHYIPTALFGILLVARGEITRRRARVVAPPAQVDIAETDLVAVPAGGRASDPGLGP